MTSPVTKKLRVGVIGTGLIAQVMHLHFLRELRDRYEIAALCDISEESAQACADEYGVAKVFTDWRELIREPLDAVMILTSGSHAPIAIAAAEAGLHVFVEKPMCFSVVEGHAMVEAANNAGVQLMVGYPKRYDPAFVRFREGIGALAHPKLLRVTTCESPFHPYVTHYPLNPPGAVDEEIVKGLRADTQERLAAAIGTDDPFYVNQYHAVMLDTLVHEINTVRGVFGEPDRLDYVDLREGSLTVMLTFGETAVAIHWIDLPGITRYLMEFAVFDDDGRATLSFPSPFLRNAPTLLAIECGDAGAVNSWRREGLTSYESGFKLELVTFYDAVVHGAKIPTDGVDGTRDIALCQAIIRSAREGVAIEQPTKL
ncbi:MAG TPA: Gfo/Idh/MocA family oxidoreductase [Acidimicrobiales bacterium]|nr:Gfo/Idh/MocA family oxidoreductase [Acidimicrobiales bacterium]